MPTSSLSIEDHRTSSTGMTHVYAVVSRRARGVSVGINLSPTHVCPWRCAYCQVEGLVTSGRGASVEPSAVANELSTLLERIQSGSFFDERVPEPFRRLADVALSGDGEPTACPDVERVITYVRTVLDHHGLEHTPIILITNGALIDLPGVQRALDCLARSRGVVWFKVDAVTRSGLERMNGVALEPRSHLERLETCAGLCPTWVQTCLAEVEGVAPAPDDIDAYVIALARVRRACESAQAPGLRGVHLYGPARRPAQGVTVTSVSSSVFNTVASKLEQQGFVVTINE